VFIIQFAYLIQISITGYVNYEYIKISKHYNQPRIVSMRMKLTQKVDHFNVFKNLPSTSCCSEKLLPNNFKKRLVRRAR